MTITSRKNIIAGDSVDIFLAHGDEYGLFIPQRITLVLEGVEKELLEEMYNKPKAIITVGQAPNEYAFLPTLKGITETQYLLEFDIETPIKIKTYRANWWVKIDLYRWIKNIKATVFIEGLAM